MSFLSTVLREPSYGWRNSGGEVVVPSTRQLFKELFSRINIFKTKKNWLAATSWAWTLLLIPFLLIFIFNYFSWWLAVIGFIYSMCLLGSHGTIWHHRYATHKAYKFSNRFWRFLTANLVIKLVPEETYVVSHHVHHALSDKAGDPYNAKAGWLYCFLADTNHQPIATDLKEVDYNRTAGLLKGTGIYINNYKQYQKWGSVSNPYWTWMHMLLNWSFWFATFFLIGGYPLAFAIFGFSHIWAVGIRTFNYEGHGKGKDAKKEGLDFGKNDYSINQYWPGIVAGEWHNNHHLFPNSARNGFTPSQIDIPWYYIKLLHLIGGVSSYNDSKEQFLNKYYNDYKKEKIKSQKSIISTIK